jgi:Protein of unknown function (DUF3616)
MQSASLVAAMVLVGCIGAHGACAQQGSTIPLTSIDVKGDFEVKGKKDDVAVDISGIACLPLRHGQRTCLLINDENRNAQLATIKNDRMVVGDTVKLIGKDPDPDTLGSPPQVKCSKEDGFKDLDGEGVAYAEPYFYVVGSHGCSRKGDEFRLSSFILARVKVDRNGEPSKVKTTYRLSDLLARAGAAAPFFGKDLESANGLNIEGIAAKGDTLWFGLRAPVAVDSKGLAYLVRADASDLFGSGHAPSDEVPKVIPVALEGLGIRDIAPLPGRHLLILAGAAHGPEVPFRLFVVDSDSGDASPIGVLAEVKETVGGETKVGKAEGIVVLDATANRVQFVVVFDSLPNGAPRQGEALLPK